LKRAPFSRREEAPTAHEFESHPDYVPGRAQRIGRLRLPVEAPQVPENVPRVPWTSSKVAKMAKKTMAALGQNGTTG